MTSDGQSGAILAWCDYRNGTDYDVYAQKVDSAGVVGVAEVQEAGSHPSTALGTGKQEARLMQNQPNPFSLSTVIQYEIPAAGRVNLRVYSLSGQEVKALVDSEREAGRYSVVWNGTDSQARRVASGVYFYRLELEDLSEVRQMTCIH